MKPFQLVFFSTGFIHKFIEHILSGYFYNKLNNKNFDMCNNKVAAISISLGTSFSYKLFSKTIHKCIQIKNLLNDIFGI